MEHATGGTLDEQIKKANHEKVLIDKVRVLKWIYQICSAMEYLSAYKALHRDLKPDNILLDG